MENLVLIDGGGGGVIFRCDMQNLILYTKKSSIKEEKRNSIIRFGNLPACNRDKPPAHNNKEI
jgi:hypothetical protein